MDKVCEYSQEFYDEMKQFEASMDALEEKLFAENLDNSPKSEDCKPDHIPVDL